jgi:histidyl-tRNA synthetase
VGRRQRELRKPIKWFSIPACWRYERPQRGRVREHWQWNVDLLGIPGAEAEAEIIAVFATFLREIGLDDADFCVRIGHRAWLAERLSQIGVPPDAQLPVLKAIDRREKLPAGEFDRQLIEAGLDTRQRLDLDSLLESRDFGDYPPLRDLFELLEWYGLAGVCEFDPGIVRGLAYYTSTVCEIWDRRRELRAIAGGGRYDDLTVALGGERLPGVGMAMGDVVLTLLLRREDKLPVARRELDAFVVSYSASEWFRGIKLATDLRRAGLRVDRSLQSASMSRQLRQAESVGARTVVILAPTELARGEVVVRDLETGAQRDVPLAEVEEVVRRR